MMEIAATTRRSHQPETVTGTFFRVARTGSCARCELPDDPARGGVPAVEGAVTNHPSFFLEIHLIEWLQAMVRKELTVAGVLAGFGALIRQLEAVQAHHTNKSVDKSLEAVRLHDESAEHHNEAVRADAVRRRLEALING